MTGMVGSLEAVLDAQPGTLMGSPYTHGLRASCEWDEGVLDPLFSEG